MAHRTTRPTDRDDDRLTEYTREGEHGLVTTEKCRRESDLFGDERETLTDGGTVATQAATADTPDESPAETLADDVRADDCVSAATVDDDADAPSVWIFGRPDDIVFSRVLEKVREHGFVVEWVSTYESVAHDDAKPYFRVKKAD